jgi:VPDSG-CTERM motif
MKKIITSITAIAIFVTMTGVAQATQVGNVPDAGTTSALLGIAVAGLAIVRRFVR